MTCSDSDSCSGRGCGVEAAGEKAGSEGDGWSREACEGAGEMGSLDTDVKGVVVVGGGGVGVGVRERPCAVSAFITTSQPFSRDFMRSLSSSFSWSFDGCCWC